MIGRLSKLAGDCRGATAIEYGLIVALIVIGLIASISALGGTNGSAWGNMTNKAGAALPAA